MTNIEWGAEIPVNGVRPDWLGDGEQVLPCWKTFGLYDSPNGVSVRYVCGWYEVTTIKLPSDHEYYRRRMEPMAEWQGAPSEPVAPPGYVLVKQMSEGEWRNDRTAGSLYWARNQGIIRPETRLEQFERESGIAITDGNRDAVVAALEWGRDA